MYPEEESQQGRRKKSSAACAPKRRTTDPTAPHLVVTALVGAVVFTSDIWFARAGTLFYTTPTREWPLLRRELRRWWREASSSSDPHQRDNILVLTTKATLHRERQIPESINHRGRAREKRPPPQPSAAAYDSFFTTPRSSSQIRETLLLPGVPLKVQEENDPHLCCSSVQSFRGMHHPCCET